jgi:hypothetical protein
MLSIEKCKEVLNGGEKHYTDFEIKQLRELLFSLADIELNQIEADLKSQKGKLIVLNNYFIPMLKVA